MGCRQSLENLSKQPNPAVEKIQLGNTSLNQNELHELNQKVQVFIGHEHGEGNILWTAKGNINKEDVFKICEIYKKRNNRSLHINVTTQVNKDGNLMKRTTPWEADTYLDIGNTPQIINNASCSVLIVNNHQIPLYYKHVDILDAWSNSEEDYQQRAINQDENESVHY